MLKKKLTEYITKEAAGQDSLKIEMFKEEIDYAKKHQLIEEGIALIEKNPILRFNDAYIERSDKESEELIAEETTNFLNEAIDFLKKNKNEFIYIESEWFDIIGADSVCLEVDDVFGNYHVMLGLKLQKKYENALKEQLKKSLKGAPLISLMFSHSDGLWEFNFSLNNVDGFNENLTIGEAYQLVYRFLFSLVEAVEEGV